MTKKIKLGIIGTGAGLRTHFPAFANSNTEIVGIVGKDFEKTKKIANDKNIIAYKDYKTLCDVKDIDLIVIASPNYFHYEQIKYAILKGKNILAEKPLVLSLKENEELIDLIEKKDNNKLYLVNHQLRFNSYIKAIKKIIKSKKLGYIYHVSINQQSSAFSKKNINPSWSFEKSKGGGVRLAMGSHLIDLVRFLFPNKQIHNVFANSNSVINKRNNKTYFKDTNASSFFSANLSIEDNINVQLLVNAATLGESKFEIAIYGSDGELHFDLKNKLTLKLIGEDEFTKVDFKGISKEELNNEISIFRSSFKEFAPLIINALENNDKSLIYGAPDFKDSLKILKILKASETSVLEKKSVNLSN